MGLFKVIAWGIIIYFLYKFIFGVVVPVSKAAGEMKSKIAQMQQQQDQYLKQQQQHFQQQQAKQHQTTTKTEIEGEYIDYEEIKTK
jgi:Sec-independent protein translocase protein TatA